MCKIQNTLFLLLHDLVLECFYHLEQDQADEAGDDKDREIQNCTKSQRTGLNTTGVWDFMASPYSPTEFSAVNGG